MRDTFITRYWPVPLAAVVVVTGVMLILDSSIPDVHKFALLLTDFVLVGYLTARQMEIIHDRQDS